MGTDEISMDNLKDIMANPFYAVTVHEDFIMPHEPLVSKEDWVKVNVRSALEDDNGNKLTLEQVEQKLVEQYTRLLDLLDGTK